MYMAALRYFIRAGIVGMALLVSWIAFVSWKQIARNNRIESEVSILQREADKIRRENETLGEKIRYFSTDDFREQEAKEKLGMKKEDEEGVVIKPQPESVVVTEVTEKKIKNPSMEMNEEPNYRKWWNLFFETQ